MGQGDLVSVCDQGSSFCLLIPDYKSLCPEITVYLVNRQTHRQTDAVSTVLHRLGPFL